jgi:thiamine pyrophosphate-dependent acetolactate synthase large subunit-like protein
MNFPNTHPLNHSNRRGSLIRQADVVLLLEPQDTWGLTHRLQDIVGRPWRRTLPDGVKVVTIGSGSLLIHANYQEFQRYAAVDIAIAGDAQASLPSLIEHVRHELSDSRRSQLAARGAALADEFAKTRQARFAALAATWDLSPVCPARVAMELWAQIKGEDWALAGDNDAMALELWDVDKHYQHTGGSGAAGVGYAAGAAIGAALAHRDEGRLSISIQPDGDLMYGPGVLWTAAHHQIPTLMVMFNNRGYHQEIMHLQRMANRHNRSPYTYEIGNVLKNPDIDFAKMAQSMGWYAEGPITDPGDIREAVTRALAVVKGGEPALLDIVQQPRPPELV